MVILILIVLGLCLGSFINALVWRTYENSRLKRSAKINNLSIINGRSMCPNCRHQLKAIDLIPLISWLSLKGKCRYCKKPISIQYPIVELITAVLFVSSYIWWPHSFHGYQISIFVGWLAILVGLISLCVYDFKWFLLPNKILYPVGVLAIIESALLVFSANNHLSKLFSILLSGVIGGGIFYIIFQISDGKWIGGGDVKLGFILGLIAASPNRSILYIFLGCLSGSLITIPMLATKRMNRTSLIPFGPLLIIGIFVTQLFGSDIINWYQQHLLTVSPQ